MKRRLGAWLARLGGAMRRVWRQWFAPAEGERPGLPDPAWREDAAAAPASPAPSPSPAAPGVEEVVEIESGAAAPRFAGDPEPELRAEAPRAPPAASAGEPADGADSEVETADPVVGTAGSEGMAAACGDEESSSEVAETVSPVAASESAGAETVSTDADIVAAGADAVSPLAEAVFPDAERVSPGVDAASVVVKTAPAAEEPASLEPEPVVQAASAPDDGPEDPSKPEAAVEATAENATCGTPVRPEEAAALEETTPFADEAAQPEAVAEVVRESETVAAAAPEPGAVVEMAAEPDTRVEVAPGPESAGEAAFELETPAAAETSTDSASAAPPAPAEATPATAPRPRPVLEIPKDYVPAAESEHELYRIELETFEGPLDLLLFLIRRHALDIFDIPVAFICERYLGYLKLMEELNIDVAAEFLAMAAELLHIKSKMLLPKPVEVDDDDEADPRAELVRRLLEYQKYKDAAERLASLTRTGRDVFGRTPELLPPPEGPAPLAEVSLFALVEAFDALLARQKPELRHHVLLEAASVRQRIRALIEVFAERRQVRFVELLGDLAHRLDVVVSFLAILEMARLRLLRVYQSLEGEIHLEGRFETVEQALEQLEGIDKSLDGILEEAAASEKGARE